MVSTGRGGSRVFMRKWHETERRKAAERRAKPAAAPSTRGISKRPGGGERGGGGRGKEEKGAEEGRRGVMTKSLKSGFGHHRHKSCGPSSGRHKIV